MGRLLLALAAALTISTTLRTATAGESLSEPDARLERRRDVRDEIPRVLFVDSAFGMKGGVFGAAASGGGSFAQTKSHGIGGGLIAYAPIDRLTFDIAGGRTSDARWAPAATGSFRFLGSFAQGFALAGLARYKAEGFTEYGGEIELGLGGGLRSHRLVLDGNLVMGVGLENEGAGAQNEPGKEAPTEIDGEAKLRFGYEITDSLRLGVEGQSRKRFNGSRQLAGGRTSDVAFGAQAMLRLAPMFAALTVGPTTRDVERGVGAFGWVTIGFVL